MKKSSILSFALAAFLPFMAVAGNHGGGFVSGTSPQEIITVDALEKLSDDSYVVLQGTITAKVADEKYTFQDKTGTVQIEIDDDDWNGLTVKPGDVVIIEGELDKNWTGPDEIEVDVIRMAQ